MTAIKNYLLKLIKNRVVILTLTGGLIFASYFSIHYYQIFYKGYPLDVYDSNLTLARNLHFTGLGYIEDEKNIYLSTDLVAERGQKNDAGNKLTPIFYKYIFDLFGFSYNLPIFVSLFLWSLSAVFIFLILYKFFNIWIGLIGSIIDILLPYFWIASTTAGFYELAILFFIFGLFFYLKREKYYYLFFAGIFFALAILARNAFVISAAAIAIFELYQRKSIKRLIFLTLPMFLIVGFSFTVDLIKGENYYLTEKSNSFSYYSELFPDSYTYHFNKEQYLEQIKNEVKGDTANFLEMYGYNLGFKGKVKLYLNSAIYYLKNFFRLPILGGPMILLLMILGFYYLLKENKLLAKLFFIWLTIWYLGLIFMKTSNYNHFIEIRLIIVALSAFGFFKFLKVIFEDQKNSLKKNLWLGLIFIFLFYQFFLTTKFILGRAYEGNNLMTLAVPLIEKVNSLQISPKNDVMAVDTHPALIGALNYYTNKNYIYFAPETVKKLITEKKLKEAFAYYGVTYAIDYGQDLNQGILDQTEIKIIKAE